MFRIIAIPGFQQEGLTSEYRVDCSSCERIVCNYGVKKPVLKASICPDVQAVKEVFSRLDSLEWPQVIDLGKYNTVDDAEQVVFSGEFGRVSIPLRHCADNERLSISERTLCAVLLELLQAIEALQYVPHSATPDSPPTTPRG